MAFEMVCGNCQGRLRVEMPGMVVACPHCGTHLTIPAAETEDPSQASTTGAADESSGVPEPTRFPGTPGEAQEPPSAETASDEHEPPAEAPPLVEETVVSEPSVSEQSGATFEEVSEPPGPSETVTAVPEQPAANEQPTNFETTESAAASPEDGALPDWMTPVEETAPAEPFPDFAAMSKAAESDAATPAAERETVGTESDAEPAASVESNDVGATPAGSPEFSWGANPPGENQEVGFPALGQSSVAPTEQSAESAEAPAEPVQEAVVPAGAPAFAPPAEPGPPPAAPAASQTAGAAPTPAPRAAAASSASTSSSDGPVVSRSLFLMVVSYASAVTLAFVYLLIKSLYPNPHELESLPDLKPPMRDDQVALQLVPEDASMPRGHTLQFGETQRFGNLKVTPLRVTRGPLEFEHFTGNQGRNKSATSEVLKLWLRFENVSDEQVFAPLDRKLMLTRVPSKDDPGRWRANNFVCRLQEKSQEGEQVLVYDMPPESEWDWKEHQTGHALKPGESMVTYIPTTEEGIEQLDGELVWRVHFRKGYHPESKRGVTTLIEVVFDSEAIEREGRAAQS